MDSSTRKAAILLWKVMKTASKEMEVAETTTTTTPIRKESMTGEHLATRPRLVSIGSQDTVGSATSSPLGSPNGSPVLYPMSSPSSSSSDRHQQHPVVFQLNQVHHQRSTKKTRRASVTTNSAAVRKTFVPVEEDEATDEEEEEQEDEEEDSHMVPSGESTLRVSTATLVGKKAQGNHVKAILRKKFAWKNYPELENFLIQHRAEYLQYSSSLNYTAEQKRYNNTLTNGLLALAEQHGYVFDDFTFPMVRDRIRCYYKSYVQAARKKQRRHG